MAEFQPAFNFVMDHEDPGRTGKVTVDAGGRTRFGIASKFHPDLPEEFFTGDKAAALDQAETILRVDYWKPLNLELIENQTVASKLFDMAVNMGVHQACVLAQRACNAYAGNVLLVDGKIAAKSLAALNSADPAHLIVLLCDFSEAYYRHVASNNPGQAGNLRGWLARAAMIPPADEKTAVC